MVDIRFIINIFCQKCFNLLISFILNSWSYVNAEVVRIRTETI